MPSKDSPFDMPGRSGDDEELVRDFRSGSAQALGVIFDRYYRLVFATAWRVLRDVGEAEDLTQSVFFEIFRKASHFDPAKGPLNKWILTLAYHRSLNRKSYLMTRQFYKGHLDLIGENGEIAEQTQQTFGNVRNQYYRGLKRLRAHLTGPSREEQRLDHQSQGSQVAPVLRHLGRESVPILRELRWRCQMLPAVERAGTEIS
jgi:RNA polymerase sigma-70 factor (ECF subfamily)